jgi:hypothetical protein
MKAERSRKKLQNKKEQRLRKKSHEEAPRHAAVVILSTMLDPN